MTVETPLQIALGSHTRAPGDWMPASKVRPFIFGDPAVVWLEYHGAKHGFRPDTTFYGFSGFLAEKSRQFEEAWLAEVAPTAPRVCSEPQDARSAQKVRETFELMRRGTPVIAQPALWWAPARVYGAPDLVAQAAWLRQRFPDLLGEKDAQTQAPNLDEGSRDRHYVVLDLKFTTKLDDRRKARDRESYAAQVRIYTYMVGQLQGYMPTQAFLVSRDRVFEPLPVDIVSELDGPLDGDLAAIRDQFIEIKLNGERYVPWRDEIVAYNLDERSERWQTAMEIIAREKTPGRDPRLLYRVGPAARGALASQGYARLDDLLAVDPDDLPLEEFKGIGAKTAGQMRAVLASNRSGTPVLPPPGAIPPQRPFEFYVDVEYFTNVNVDFQRQWPTLDGCEMVFMIGLGCEDNGDWRYRSFVAGAESQDEELTMFERFLDFLEDETEGAVLDASRSALYHWSAAEVWQTRAAARRHQLPEDHPLRRLPWIDLQKALLDGPGALPGAWTFGLKTVAEALAAIDPEYATRWPDSLDAGLNAMVMGWKAYEGQDPRSSPEMVLLQQYLEADCQAVWQILRWLRANAGQNHGGKP